MKVLIADKINEKAVEYLEKEGFEVTIAWDTPKDDLVHMISEYHGIIIRSATKMRGDMLNKATNLKIIGRAGVGLDNVDLDAARARDIRVENTPAATTNSVAELALTMILASTRNVILGTTKIKETPSSFKKVKKELFATEIEGKTLGVIGTGRIGSSLAVKAKALGMNAIGYDAYIKESGVIELQSNIEKVFEKADYISLHLPLTDETKHMISTDEFEQMKDGVVLINCARGGVVDESAAYVALKSGKLKIYATDVFEKEPPSEDNPLLSHPNVIITPHIGAQTYEGNLKASMQAAEKVADALKE